MEPWRRIVRQVARLVPIRADLCALFRVALPIVVVQVGMMSMGVVDTLMVGRVSAPALAAVALGNLYFFTLTVFGIGMLMALDPIVAQAVGAGDRPGVARAFQRGILLAAAMTIPIASLHLLAGPALALVGQPSDVVPLAAAYALAIIPGIFPFLAFTVMRQTLQAMAALRPIVYTIVLANLLNVALNDVLIFGEFGLPPLGVVGSAWATTVSRWSMALGLFLFARPILAPLIRPWRKDSAALVPLGRMIRVGLPIGGQLQLEMGAFAGIALLMGWLGTNAVAGHQVAINLASLTFQVPLGIGSATAVLVGQAVGRSDPGDARRAASAALLMGSLFMGGTCIMFLSVPSGLARLYTSNPEVLAVASTLIPLAGLFQVFDGIQAVAIGALRGLGDTKAPFLINIVGFWLIGIPVSLVVGFVLHGGPEGLWWGLVAGLAVVAGILVWRVRRKLTGDVLRLVIDGDDSTDFPGVGQIA